MSETMVGNFDFLDQTPVPETPVDQIPPPKDRTERRTLERFGISFISGPQDAGELLDGLRVQTEQWLSPSKPEGKGPDRSLDATRIDNATPKVPKAPQTILDADTGGGPGGPGAPGSGSPPETILDDELNVVTRKDR
ncbi:hypothetical protein ACFQ07_03795, partial [Actinomadura adrarensis]